MYKRSENTKKSKKLSPKIKESKKNQKIQIVQKVKKKKLKKRPNMPKRQKVQNQKNPISPKCPKDKQILTNITNTNQYVCQFLSNLSHINPNSLPGHGLNSLVLVFLHSYVGSSISKNSKRNRKHYWSLSSYKYGCSQLFKYVLIIFYLTIRAPSNWLRFQTTFPLVTIINHICHLPNVDLKSCIREATQSFDMWVKYFTV